MKITPEVLTEMLTYVPEKHVSEIIRAVVLSNWEEVDHCKVKVRFHPEEDKMLFVQIEINARAIGKADEIMSFMLATRDPELFIWFDRVGISIRDYRSEG